MGGMETDFTALLHRFVGPTCHPHTPFFFTVVVTGKPAGRPHLRAARQPLPPRPTPPAVAEWGQTTTCAS